MIHGVMPRSPRSLVLKGYTNTSLEQLKWIRYAADRLQAWTWRGGECESQTSDKKTPKPTNFTFHFHLQLNTKHTETHHYWEGKSAECVSSGGGTGRWKVKPPTFALLEIIWGVLSALVSHAAPKPSIHTQIHPDPCPQLSTDKDPNLLIRQLIFIESEKTSS